MNILFKRRTTFSILAGLIIVLAISIAVPRVSIPKYRDADPNTVVCHYQAMCQPPCPLETYTIKDFYEMSYMAFDAPLMEPFIFRRSIYKTPSGGYDVDLYSFFGWRVARLHFTTTGNECGGGAVDYF